MAVSVLAVASWFLRGLSKSLSSQDLLSVWSRFTGFVSKSLRLKLKVPHGAKKCLRSWRCLKARRFRTFKPESSIFQLVHCEVCCKRLLMRQSTRQSMRHLGFTWWGRMKTKISCSATSRLEVSSGAASAAQRAADSLPDSVPWRVLECIHVVFPYVPLRLPCSLSELHCTHYVLLLRLLTTFPNVF